MTPENYITFQELVLVRDRDNTDKIVILEIF